MTGRPLDSRCENTLVYHCDCRGAGMRRTGVRHLTCLAGSPAIAVLATQFPRVSLASSIVQPYTVVMKEVTSYVTGPRSGGRAGIRRRHGMGRAPGLMGRDPRPRNPGLGAPGGFARASIHLP
jgi:hypothetical protein